MDSEEGSIGYKFELTLGDAKTSVLYTTNEPWDAETWNLIMHGRNTTIVVGSGEITTNGTMVIFSVYGDEEDTIVSSLMVPVELCRQAFGSQMWQDHTWRHREKKEDFECTLTAKAKMREELEEKLDQVQNDLMREQNCESLLQAALQNSASLNAALQDAITAVFNQRPVNDHLQTVLTEVRYRRDLASIRAEVMANSLAVLDSE